MKDPVLDIFHYYIEYVVSSNDSAAECLNLLHTKFTCTRSHSIITYNIVNAQLLKGYSLLFSVSTVSWAKLCYNRVKQDPYIANATLIILYCGSEHIPLVFFNPLFLGKKNHKASKIKQTKKSNICLWVKFLCFVFGNFSAFLSVPQEEIFWRMYEIQKDVLWISNTLKSLH